MLDEIITGCGKTGRMFAFEHSGAVPDILVIGKSLGGGLIPIGALIARKKYWRKFGLSFPMSASSFAGNALASRAALTTIHLLQQEGFLDDCQKKGRFLLERLQGCLEKYPDILKRVDGIGLLIGVETGQPQKTIKLVKEMIQQGVLAALASGNPSVLMLEPPLVINFDQLQNVLEAFEKACKALTPLP
jgi:putrescine aminotransferase